MSYLINRNGVMHYRRHVPKDVQPFVGKEWWKASLRTGNQREAEVKARALAVEHDKLIAQVRGQSADDKLEDLLARRQQLLETVGDLAEARFEADPRRALKILDHPVGHSFSDHELRSLGMSPDEIQLLRDADRTSAAAGTALRKWETVALRSAKQQFTQLPAAEQSAVASAGGVESLYRNTRALAAERIRFLSGGELDEGQKLLVEKRFSEQRSLLGKIGVELPGIPEDRGNPRVNRAIELWFADRKQGEAAVKRHRVAVRRFVDLHGNIPVGQITRGMIREYRDAIANLADQRGLPLHQRGGLADGERDEKPLPRVSAKTVERHLTTLKALLTWCVEQDFVTVNVATGVKPPKDTRPKASKRRAS